jgi:hypothetical protein
MEESKPSLLGWTWTVCTTILLCIRGLHLCFLPLALPRMHGCLCALA